MADNPPPPGGVDTNAARTPPPEGAEKIELQKWAIEKPIEARARLSQRLQEQQALEADLARKKSASESSLRAFKAAQDAGRATAPDEEFRRLARESNEAQADLTKAQAGLQDAVRARLRRP